MDLARRFRALGKQSGSLPVPAPKVLTMPDDARADPEVAKKMELLDFIEKAMANLKAREDTGT